MRGVFVTATDTGVGKTYLAGAIAAELRRQGLSVGVAKPVLTGLDDPGPHDHELLGATPAYTFQPPVSPHLAAELAGTELDPRALLANARGAAEGHDVVVVEGVGGLLVPLTRSYTVRDFALELGLPVVVAARPALGTINHTLLTLEAARDLDVRAVVLTPWPQEPSVIEASNREFLEAHVLERDGDASNLPVMDWLS
ncbi:MAG: dethiobiotin synthase [Solirubrobacteraceae bacterium]